MSDYTQAPATRILATHCCACGLPLLDAESVEQGIGPTCRKKLLGRSQGRSDAARVEANQIGHRLALAISGGGSVALGQALVAPDAQAQTRTQIDRLRDLGFDKLADKLAVAWMPIRIEETDGVLAVKTPFREESLAMTRAIAGRNWDGARKVNVYPTSSRDALWRMLCRYYPGVAGIGPDGPFAVPLAVPLREGNSTSSADRQAA